MSSLWTPGGERPVEPSTTGNGEHDDRERPDQLSPEDQEALAQQMAAMQAELANTPASVVIANHAVGLFQLAAIHLNQRPPNLDDGRLAIDALAGVVESLGGRLGEEEQALKDALAQLRMAYVQLRDAGPAEASSD